MADALQEGREALSDKVQPAIPDAVEHYGGVFSDDELPCHAAPPVAPAAPVAHVGESGFEGWFSTYNAARKGDKQRARDAYAAGMGDPLVTAAPVAPQPMDTSVALADLMLALAQWKATNPRTAPPAWRKLIEACRAMCGADAAPPAPAAAPAIDDPVTVPRGLLGAACSAIDHKRDAPKVLAELRRYTVGDLSPPLPPYAPPAAAPAEGARIRYVDCGECPRISTGCEAGHCLQKRKVQAGDSNAQR